MTEEFIVKYTPTEDDLKNIQIIKDFLEETQITYEEDNEIFGLFHIKERTIQLRYVNSFYHKIDLSKRFGEICKGIPKNYFIDISHNNARQNIRTIWIFDFEMSQTNTIMKDGKIIHDYHRQWEVIKNTIRTATGHIKHRFYARDFEIKEISNTTLRNFLEVNCFYGYRSANTNLGMFLKKDRNGFKAGTLMMIYTFGYNFYGNRGREDDPFIEIIRVSTLLGCQVIGGASKFLTYFFEHYPTLDIAGKIIPVKELKFYVDDSNNKGVAMSKLGFIFNDWVGGGFMNCWAKDYDGRPDLPLYGKKGEIFHRKPAYHKQIMELIGKGIIYSIENAGTAVYSTTKDEFFEFINSKEERKPALLSEQINSNPDFFKGARAHKPRNQEEVKKRKERIEASKAEKESKKAATRAKILEDLYYERKTIDSLNEVFVPRETVESKVEVEENTVEEVNPIIVEVEPIEPKIEEKKVEIVEEVKKEIKPKKKSKEREELSDKLTNMLGNLTNLLKIKGIDSAKLNGLIENINEQVDTMKAQEH